MRKKRIWTGARTTRGHGRAAILALLREMVAQDATGMPGPRNSRKEEGNTDLNSYNNDPSPSMGRARVRNPGPCPHPDPTPCLPYTWSPVTV